MFVTEKQIKTGMITTTGFLVTLVAIVLYFMWFIIGTIQTAVYGSGGLVLILVFTAAAIRYFYNKRSSGMELIVEGLATAGAITILIIVDPTDAYPTLPVFFKKLLSLTLYLVLVTFATQFLKPEMIADPREKAFVRGIQAAAGIVVSITILWLTFRWYIHSVQSFFALVGCLILTALTIAFFKDDISDDFQVCIELFTIVGVPCLILWAKPNPIVDPGYDWLKKIILAVLYLVAVSFALMFIDNKKEPTVPIEEEPEEPEHDPPVVSIKIRNLLQGHRLPFGDMTILITSPPLRTDNRIKFSGTVFDRNGKIISKQKYDWEDIDKEIYILQDKEEVSEE